MVNTTEQMEPEKNIYDIDEACNTSGNGGINGGVQGEISIEAWIELQEKLEIALLMAETYKQKNIVLEEENEALRLRILHSEYNSYRDDYYIDDNLI